MSRSLQIGKHPEYAGRYLLKTEILLPERRESVFEFFADAYRLESITPPWLRFQVLTEPPIPMQPGQRIDYKLKLRGIPVRWQSEISVWEPPARFVDRQIRGPYTRWHHEHIFEEHPQGTLVRDRVEYAVPGGGLVNRLFVKRRLEQIFQFRQAELTRIFSGSAE